MEKMKKLIDDSRNVKENSLKAYMINLRRSWEAIGSGKEFNVDFLSDKDKVFKFLEKYSLPTQRAYISSYIVALDALNNKKNEDLLKFYRDELIKMRKTMDEKHKNGERTEKQEKNWTGMDALRKVVRSLRRDLSDDDVFNKETLSKRNMRELQDWVIGNLFVGDDNNPPTRLDYAPMKIVTKKEYDDIEDKDGMNYYVKNGNKPFFSFNDYKTSDKYGTKEIKVGKHLFQVMKQWLKHNDGEYLLYNDKGQPMNAHQLGVRVKKIFSRTGKNVTANLIRNMYVSEKFPREEREEREEVASKMGHSVGTQQTIYSKKVD
tara:strand:- start:499 stop:1455 length:957 start_codon:yes stop_codon:yes gene_type:complete